MEERIVREFGIDMYTLPYLKWITKKALLYITGNSAQCYMAAWMGAGFEGEWIKYIRMAESLRCSLEATLLIGYTSIQNKKF